MRLAVMHVNLQFSRSGSQSALFETWLQSELQHLYDHALDEPVPSELLQILIDAHEGD